MREIGERMGRAIAIYLLGSGPECRDAPWSGIYPLDPDLDDELERVGILPGTPEFEEAERAAKQAYANARWRRLSPTIDGRHLVVREPSAPLTQVLAVETI